MILGGKGAEECWEISRFRFCWFSNSFVGKKATFFEISWDDATYAVLKL